jgi:beta-galactosidase
MFGRWKLIAGFFLLLSAAGVAQPAPPKPAGSRYPILGYSAAHAQHNENALGTLFDDHWKFTLGDPNAAGETAFDDKAWRTIDLPHDWSIEGVPDRQNPSKGPGGYFPTGIGWYRKHFMAAPSWKAKEVSIFFEGVYMNAAVFINGHSLGIHPYGYTSFYYDLTPWLHWSGDNVIAVRVDNSQQINSRWYSGSGIYRHVRIAVKAPVHIDPLAVAITTPHATPDKATVNIDALLKNGGTSTADVVLSAQIIDRNRRVVATKEVSIWLPAKGESHVSPSIIVNKPLLWSVDSPNLYRLHLVLTQNGKQKDEYTSAFGIRTIAFSPAHGFLLNGNPMKLSGGCMHHDNGCLGAAAFDRAEERKIQLLKAAGFNAVRTSHNPPSIAFLDACDRLGLLVIDEAFDGWRQAKNPYDYTRYFDDWWRRDLTSMILRDRNHPSIVIWSVGNEILERKSPDAINTARNLVALVHQYDTTRPVTSAMTTWDKEWEMYDPLFSVQDLAGYNYQLFRAAADHERVPSRVIVQTESYPRDVFVNWNTIRQNSYLIGDFVWTAMDYLGESGIGKNNYPGEPQGQFWEAEQFPWHGSYCGDIDLIGQRKPISHYRNILNNSAEKLYMAVREPKPDTGNIQETIWSVWPTRESWTWPGREGKDLDVEVYSKYPAIRLYLNDNLVGEKRCTAAEEYKANFTLPYSPGMLKAVGMSPDGREDSITLRTANPPAFIKLTPDRKRITADGQDLSFIRVELVDRQGTIAPNAANRLNFFVTGPATLAGVGNADMADTDSYAGPSRKAWHGEALAVIRSTRETGKITVAVSTPGLPTSTITIQSNYHE